MPGFRCLPDRSVMVGEWKDTPRRGMALESRASIASISTIVYFGLAPCSCCASFAFAFLIFPLLSFPFPMLGVPEEVLFNAVLRHWSRWKSGQGPKLDTLLGDLTWYVRTEALVEAVGAFLDNRADLADVNIVVCWHCLLSLRREDPATTLQTSFATVFS